MEIVADNSMKNMRFIRKLPIPKEVKELYPLSEKGAAVKAQRDAEIAKVLKGESSKFLLIIGPCSADKEDSVLDYVSRLARIQEEVKDKIIIIPRIYTGKPRTTGAGYKGMIHQPDPDGVPDMYAGLLAVRSIHSKSIEQLGLPAADEMLYPANYRYLSDLLSYVAVGARSVENQEQKQPERIRMSLPFVHQRSAKRRKSIQTTHVHAEVERNINSAAVVNRRPENRR